MPLDGTGSYQTPAPQFPAIPNTTIYAEDFNDIINDIADALSTAIFRDGQAPFEANQSMGGFKLMNLADGVNPADAVNFLQVFTNPSFTASGATGFVITGTRAEFTVDNLDLSASTLVQLPADTSIGTVTSVELAYLTGLTGNIQDQIDQEIQDRIDNDALKANLAGGNTFTGTQNMLAALSDGSTATTQSVGDASTKLATTAFVTATAFNSALPGQAGNAGKVVTTDGANASWTDTKTLDGVSLLGTGNILTNQTPLITLGTI